MSKNITIEIPASLASALALYMENMNYDEPITREYLREELGEERLVAAESLYEEIMDQLFLEDNEQTPPQIPPKAIPQKAKESIFP